MHNHGRGRSPAAKWLKLAALASMANSGFKWRAGGARRGGFDGFGGDAPWVEDGPFGGGPRDGGPRRRGRRGMFGREDLRLVLLRLIADEPRHGYDCIRAMEERSGGRYAPSPGVIYPALAMLADEGLIAEQPGADQRRRYAATAEGLRVLETERVRVGELLALLDELGEDAGKARRPQIERAVANLFVAVGQRLARGPAEGIVHDIAGILDDAARRIERL